MGGEAGAGIDGLRGYKAEVAVADVIHVRRLERGSKLRARSRSRGCKLPITKSKSQRQWDTILRGGKAAQRTR